MNYKNGNQKLQPNTVFHFFCEFVIKHDDVFGFKIPTPVNEHARFTKKPWAEHKINMTGMSANRVTKLLGYKSKQNNKGHGSVQWTYYGMARPWVEDIDPNTCHCSVLIAITWHTKQTCLLHITFIRYALSDAFTLNNSPIIYSLYHLIKNLPFLVYELFVGFWSHTVFIVNIKPTRVHTHSRATGSVSGFYVDYMQCTAYAERVGTPMLKIYPPKLRLKPTPQVIELRLRPRGYFRPYRQNMCCVIYFTKMWQTVRTASHGTTLITLALVIPPAR